MKITKIDFSIRLYLIFLKVIALWIICVYQVEVRGLVQ